MSEAGLRDESTSASRRRPWLLKLALWLLVIPLIFFGLSNIWLNTGWGTSMVESKLKERTGMDWQVQGMTWSPWNGMTIQEASMLQPEELREQLEQPLLRIDRINVQPYWIDLIRGKTRFRTIHLDSPEIMVSIEMLTAMASRVQQEKVIPAKEPQLKPKPTNSQKESAKTKPPISSEPKQQPGVSKKKEVKKEKPTPQRPPVQPAMRVLVENASLRVVSVSKDINLLDASSIDFDLALLGEDDESSIKFGELNVPGFNRIHNLEQKVVWKRPYLEIKEQEIDLGGVKLSGVAQLALLRHFPFLLDLVIEPQELKSSSLLDRLALDVKAEKIAGRLNVRGSLVKPLSWRSSMLLISDKLTVIEKHGGQKLHFDELSLPAVFQQGKLIWYSARAIGEDVAFLGNGSVSVADGVTSVTRVVASPELATFLHRLLIGVRVTGHQTWWENLDTPDRKYRDIYILGPVLNPRIDLGAKHEELSLWKTITAILHFVRVEMKEEGVTLGPVPNKELLYQKNHEDHQR